MVGTRDRHSPLPKTAGKGGPPVQEVGLGHVTCCGLELPAWWPTQGSSMGFCCPQEECVLRWPWEGAPGKGACCTGPRTPGAWSQAQPSPLHPMCCTGSEVAGRPGTCPGTSCAAWHVALCAVGLGGGARVEGHCQPCWCRGSGRGGWLGGSVVVISVRVDVLSRACPRLSVCWAFGY